MATTTRLQHFSLPSSSPSPSRWSSRWRCDQRELRPPSMTAPKTKPRTSATDANCGLAALRFVADLAQAVGRFQGPSAADLDAGLLAAALHVLEAEVCRLLADHSAPLAVQDQDRSRAASITRLRIPAAAVQKLGLILDRLTTNGRLSYCSALRCCGSSHNYVQVCAFHVGARGWSAMSYLYLPLPLVMMTSCPELYLAHGHRVTSPVVSGGTYSYILINKLQTSELIPALNCHVLPVTFLF